MPLRKSAPPSLARLGRDVSVRAGTLSAPWRVVPSFMMIGVSRGGTTSLFRALMQHPEVVRPTFHKGVNYFDLNYYRGMAWYRGHFPTRAAVARKVGSGATPHVFEASGYYLFHPFAVERIGRDLPQTKLVVMLRNPVERTYSAYQHELSRGYERETFERALDLEEARLEGEVDKMRRDPAYESFAHRHNAYLIRSHYAEQLERAFMHVPREQVHVMDSETFFTDPEPTFAALAAFLGLRDFAGMTFKRYNAEPRSDMAEATRRRLETYFAPHDERLVALLGRTPAWLSSPS